MLTLAALILSLTAPGALTLRGALASGKRVEIDAGSLAIVSEQDRSIHAERQRDLGLSISAAQGGAIAGNLTSSRQNGEFASVREQSGIYAGQGGFAINVIGNTNLVAGVIASDAEAALNRLTTGTLTASELANRERYRASSISLGGGIGGVGKDANGLPTTGTDRSNDLPGLRTGIGTISASPPVALGASGRQSGISGSAIAPGTIEITSSDAASRATAAAISRDTAAANSGALTPQYNAGKREEIALGFAAATQLANQTGTFFANRATEEQALRDQAREAVGLGDTETAARLTAEADALNRTYGAGSAVRLIATALNGAAGSNVTGSLGGLVQASAVNVLQGLSAREVKTIADSLETRDANGVAIPNARGETVRAALQAVVGCAGSAAGGAGSCGSAAIGASASVVANYLLTTFVDPQPADGNPRNLEDQEARKNLVATVVAAIATSAGLNPQAAVLAAQTETENNDLRIRNQIIQTAASGGLTVEQTGAEINRLRAKRNLTSEERALLAALETSYDALLKEFGSEAEAQRQVNIDVALGEANQGDLTFAGGAAALRTYLERGGTLEQLRSERVLYVRTTVETFIATLDLTTEQKASLRDQFASGRLSAAATVNEAVKQAMGPVAFAVGDFASGRLDELENIQLLLNALPQGRIAAVLNTVAGLGTEEYGQRLQDQLANAANAAEEAAVRAVVEQRARTAALAPGEFRIEVIGGRPVFTSKPALGEPAAGAGYQATRPEHQAGFDGEVRLGRAVQDLPDHFVVSYANKSGLHGADVVSVDANGNVYLWDNKVRNNRETIQDTPTFASLSPKQDNAINLAREDIAASNLPDSIKAVARENLRLGNFFGRTVGDGTGARNSAIQIYVNRQAVYASKITVKPSHQTPGGE